MAVGFGLGSRPPLGPRQMSKDSGFGRFNDYFQGMNPNQSGSGDFPGMDHQTWSAAAMPASQQDFTQAFSDFQHQQNAQNQLLPEQYQETGQYASFAHNMDLSGLTLEEAALLDPNAIYNPSNFINNTAVQLPEQPRKRSRTSLTGPSPVQQASTTLSPNHGYGTLMETAQNFGFNTNEYEQLNMSDYNPSTTMPSNYGYYGQVPEINPSTLVTSPYTTAPSAQLVSQSKYDQLGLSGVVFPQQYVSEMTTSNSPSASKSSREASLGDKDQHTAHESRRPSRKDSVLRVCTDCGTTESPEWRKGPTGPKTLCNACGLRYAKRIKKESEAANANATASVARADTSSQAGFQLPP